jgi:hypothetical protein
MSDDSPPPEHGDEAITPQEANRLLDQLLGRPANTGAADILATATAAIPATSATSISTTHAQATDEEAVLILPWANIASCYVHASTFLGLPARSSTVWDVVKRVDPKKKDATGKLYGEGIFCCTYCLAEKPLEDPRKTNKHGTTTSNLVKHLQTKHTAKWSEFVDLKDKGKQMSHDDAYFGCDHSNVR